MQDEKQTTFAITADMTRQYKSMQEELMKRINTLETTIMEQKDQLELARQVIQNLCFFHIARGVHSRLSGLSSVWTRTTYSNRNNAHVIAKAPTVISTAILSTVLTGHYPRIFICKQANEELTKQKDQELALKDATVFACVGVCEHHQS